MTRTSRRQTALIALALTIAVTLVSAPAPRTDAADHRDGPVITGNQALDINDIYLFLDPNDNSKVVVAMSVYGAIVPAENAASGFFDHTVLFRFQFENTGDAAGDVNFDITFTKLSGYSAPQVATIKENGVTLFTAPTTVSSSTARTAPPPVITTDPTTGISIFAGLREDPFFFDVEQFFRVRADRRANGAAGTVGFRTLDTAVDFTKGYNVNAIVVSVPISFLANGTGATTFDVWETISLPQ